MNARKFPSHDFWGAGEPDCPADLKAPNGELCDMRCKVCGDGWRESHDVCMVALADPVRAALIELADMQQNGNADDVLAAQINLEGVRHAARAKTGNRAAEPLPGQPLPEGPWNVDDVMQLVFRYGAARCDIDRSNSAANQRACNDAIDAIRAYLNNLLASPPPAAPAQPAQSELMEEARQLVYAAQDWSIMFARGRCTADEKNERADALLSWIEAYLKG